MRLIFAANPYLSWRETHPELPPLSALVKNLFWQGLWGVSFSVTDDRHDEVSFLRHLVPIHINLTSNAVHDQIRGLLEAKPHSVTIWNDKREDACYDPQLFARQLGDAIQPLRLEQIPIRLQIEAEPDLVKETHKMGINSIVLLAGSDRDKLIKCLQTAKRLGISVFLSGLRDFSDVKSARELDHTDGLILDYPILQFILEFGSREALKGFFQAIE